MVCLDCFGLFLEIEEGSGKAFFFDYIISLETSCFKPFFFQSFNLMCFKRDVFAAGDLSVGTGLPFLESLTMENALELQKSYRTWLGAEAVQEPTIRDFWEEHLGAEDCSDNKGCSDNRIYFIAST